MQPAVVPAKNESLSARRAWIEIKAQQHHISVVQVALRKESVDRNLLFGGTDIPLTRSLSARRAWIEISTTSRTNPS